MYIYQSQNLTVASARNWRVCRAGARTGHRAGLIHHMQDSPGKKNRKNQKKIEKIKKIEKNKKMLGTISGAARSLIPYHFEWLYIQSWQKKSKKSKKNRKNKKK